MKIFAISILSLFLFGCAVTSGPKERLIEIPLNNEQIEAMKRDILNTLKDPDSALLAHSMQEEAVPGKSLSAAL